MRIEVTLPSMGDEDNETALVATWLVKEGDTVAEGDDLVELTTDKAAFTVPSPAAGAVAERAVDEEAEVKVGDLLCTLNV
jgi:pyruvate/2-oxoglutarate dehydrogenase complex dihydrolipoamide acyltransferase (E2) component